jgi:hypothetical protein
MTTIPELSQTLQALLTDTANAVAKTSGFIQRQRQVTGAGFAQTLVLGGIAQPAATRRQQQQQAHQVGMELSVQGLEQRFTQPAVTFMQELLRIGLEQMVNSEQERVLLPSFSGVYITDCTRLDWVQGSMKLAVRWDLQQGHLQASLHELKQHDQKTDVIERALPTGSLHLGDLGFFKLARFQGWNTQGVYWLSRFKVGTTLFTAEGAPLLLGEVLESASEPLTMAVQVGTQQRVSAYLVAARLPDDAYAKRWARLKEQARLDQRPLSARQRALARWTLYLTNIPGLTFAQAHTLARTRWQIELLFKLWKSHGNILRSRTENPVRQQCEGYGKLLGMLVTHWLLLVSGWHHAALSVLDCFRVVQTQLPFLMRVFRLPDLWHFLFEWLCDDFAHLARLSKRRKAPLAFQLWDAFDHVLP